MLYITEAENGFIVRKHPPETLTTERPMVFESYESLESYLRGQLGGNAKNAQPYLGGSIDCLELTVRTANTLKAEGVMTISDLISRSPVELLKFPNLATKTLREITAALSAHGLYLGAARTPPESENIGSET